MKKSISYYLSDITRLSDVSVHELESWINEAPYSQPLHKLLSLKLKQSGHIGSEVEYQNAAYHNVDLDHEYFKSNETYTSKITSNGEIKELVPVNGVILSHALASDEREEMIEEEVIESTEIIEIQKLVGEEEFVSEQAEITDLEHYLDSNLIYLDVMNQVIDESLDVKNPVEVDYQYQDVKDSSEELVSVTTEVKEKKAKKKKKSVSSKKVKSKKKNSSKDKKIKAKEKPAKTTKSTVEIDIKPIAKEIRYIYLEERQQSDFRIHQYNGESEYIKWLMSKKSINQETIVGKKKKDKKKKEKAEESKKVKNKKASKDKSAKKKKKKSKGKKVSAKKMVLKAAEQSVKKRDVIISETLADLLALQGYNKKAKKMYKQLSLIFPEKSGFFAARIKKLKKNSQ